MKNTIGGYNKSLSSLQNSMNQADGTVATDTLGTTSSSTSASSGSSDVNSGWAGF